MSDDKHTLTFTNTTRASVPTQSHPVEFYGLPTRCEPPEHLRGVDGWHWVQPHGWEPLPAMWHPAPNVGNEPRWTSNQHVASGTPAWAASEWGWRYLAPVTPPADVAALVEALEPFAEAVEKFKDCGDAIEIADIAHDAAITVGHLRAARAALARVRPA